MYQTFFNWTLLARIHVNLDSVLGRSGMRSLDNKERRLFLI
jgi:hypothetical protein